MVQYFLVMLGSGSEPQLPVSHMVNKINNRYTYDHSVFIQTFCFSLLVQYLINYICYSTLSYTIGFGLADSVKLIGECK